MVGRISCQTVVSVFKVFRSSSGFHSNLVNIYILGKNDAERHFEFQARDLKRIIRDFNPKEVVIDGNGLGRLMPHCIVRYIAKSSNCWELLQDNQQRSIK